MAKRQIAILAGPSKPATLRATLPLVTYVFDRLLGHYEGPSGGSVTLRRVEALARTVCAEYGAEGLEENITVAVNAALDSLMGGAVEDSKPVSVAHGGSECNWYDSYGNHWRFNVSDDRLRIELPKELGGFIDLYLGAIGRE